MSAKAQTEANQPYAELVRRAREQAGMTQAEFAAALTCEGAPASAHQVYRWEARVASVPAFVVPAAQRVAMFEAPRQARGERVG